MSNTPRPSRFSVNHLTGAVELHVVGSLYQGRLERRVRAVLAALPEGSFTPPPRALWRHYVDCGPRCRDAYELRFVARNVAAVQSALAAL